MGQLNVLAATAALIFFIITAQVADAHHVALIKYPVVDLYGSAINPEKFKLEKDLPAATKGSVVCPRIHQALFNECFQIQALTEHMAAITIPWAIYGYTDSGKAQNLYWVERKNITFIDDTRAQHDERMRAIPRFAHTKNIITLLRPFSRADGTTYSLGTQFVCTHDQPDSTAYKVMSYDTNAHSLDYFFIPHTLAFKNKKNQQPMHAKILCNCSQRLLMISPNKKRIIPLRMFGVAAVLPKHIVRLL